MKRLITITSAALIAVSFSSAAFAQAGANPSAPHPNSVGNAVETPGTTSSGTAVDKSRATGGTIGMSNGKANGSEAGNSANSNNGSNSGSSAGSAEGRTSGGGGGAGGGGSGGGSGN